MRLSCKALVYPIIVVWVCLAASAEDQFMRVDEIAPGMKGYGLTVFSGTKIERFEVEVVSIMKQAMVKGDLILIRMSGGPLSESGIVAGMSGSPVYINDKLIGAVAYGWTFAKEPIAGVTPIHEMLGVLERKPAGEVQTASADSLEAEKAGGCSMKPIMTPLMFSGVSMSLLKDIEPIFTRFGMFPVQSGGSVPQYGGPPPDLQPGSAVGVQLVRGDMDMVAIGTVTYRKGNQILAFGHPMFQGGNVDLPMVEGYVHLTLARQDRSYKLAGSRAFVGRVSRDFRPAIAGEIGQDARMIPCLVNVKSEATGMTHNYSYEIVHDKLLTPRLVQIAIAESINTTEAEVGDMMIDVSTDIHIKDMAKPVSLKNTFFDEAGPYKAFNDIYVSSSELMRNDFLRVRIERIAADISVRRARETATIETVRVDRALAEPGKLVNVIVGLRPYKAPSMSFETIPLQIPNTLPKGYAMRIIASDAQTGQQLARMLSPGAFMPGDFPQLVRLIERRENNKSIVIHALLPDLGLTTRGELLPSLPSSFFTILGGNSSAMGNYARGSVVVTAPTNWVLSGIQAATVTVGDEE